MEFSINYSLGSIYSALRFAKNPLNIVRLIDYFDKWKNAEFRVYSVSNSTCVELSFDAIFTIQEICERLGSPVPEFFDCDRCALFCSDGRIELPNLREQIEAGSGKTSVASERSSKPTSINFKMQFENYGPKNVLAYLRSDEIEKAVMRITSFCSSLTGRQKSTLTVKALADTRIISNGDIVEEISESCKRDGKIIYRSPAIGCEEGRFRFAVWTGTNLAELSREIIVSKGRFRILLPIDLSETFKKTINASLFPENLEGKLIRYVGYRVEFSLRKINYDETFCAIPDDELASNFGSCSRRLCAVLASNELELIREQAKRIRLKEEAAKLSERKKRLSKTSKVTAHEDVIYRVPEYEQDTLLLFIKLVSLNMTPLYHVNLLEYSTARGTDSIGEIQIFQEEPLRTEALVEFETVFSHFIDHKHPVSHVDFIVCWVVDEPWQTHLKKERRWLHLYEKEGKLVRVIEMSKFPKIKIKEV